MFTSRSNLLFNVCSKCNIYKTSYFNFLFKYKSTSSAEQDNGHRLLNKSICHYHHDALDVFTNTVISENVNKWKKFNCLAPNELSKTKTNSILELCDDPDHLIQYLQQCLDGCCKVSESILTRFMLTMARHGRINGLVLIEKLNAKYDYFIVKSELQMHLAEAYWSNGNLDSMFRIFETVYLTKSTKVNYVLEPIIHTIVKSRGSASVVMVSKFVKSIVVKYGDHQPMCILWKHLFLSELYDDNLDADKLTKQNSNLMENIQYLVPSITRNMLEKHRIDCVQRLMMLLLKHNRIDHYQWILRSLFEYYYLLGNVRHCKEIMKHSIELNVPLTQAQQSQLINMMLRNNKRPRQINKEVTSIIFKLMF